MKTYLLTHLPSFQKMVLINLMTSRDQDIIMIKHPVLLSQIRAIFSVVCVLKVIINNSGVVEKSLIPGFFL